jgi:hypothetical protein
MKQLTYILLFSLILLLSLPSCRKKAKTDEEMREMIVGEWQLNKPIRNGLGSIIGYKIISFDNKNRFTWYAKGKYDDTLKKGVSDIVLLSDSLYYRIINGTIFFLDKHENEIMVQIYHNEYSEKCFIELLTLKKLQFSTETNSKKIKYEKN